MKAKQEEIQFFSLFSRIETKKKKDDDNNNDRVCDCFMGFDFHSKIIQLSRTIACLFGITPVYLSERECVGKNTSSSSSLFAFVSTIVLFVCRSVGPLFSCPLISNEWLLLIFFFLSFTSFSTLVLCLPFYYQTNGRKKKCVRVSVMRFCSSHQFP